ncbi:MAG TPA: hypothetical protein VGM78_04300, partial [Ilumatobacteraceae bacterium]
MPTFTLIPQQGGGRGRLVRIANTIVYSAGDVAAASALVGWCRLVGDRPAHEVMAELTRLASGGSSLGPFCAILVGESTLDVLVQGGVPIVALRNGATEQIGSAGGQPLHTTLTGVTAINLLFGDTPVDTLLALHDGVVAADGFSLRINAATDLPWSPAASAPAEAAPAAVVPVDTPAPTAMVSLRDQTDDLPPAEPLPIVAAPAPTPTPTPPPAPTPS